MKRDDSTGGWVPMEGGGLSNVSVRKRAVHAEDDTKYEYLIYGKRITDQLVVLSCTIKKDFQYYKVMPAFHHWKTGDKKFGLTFLTSADAKAFAKGVRQARDDVFDGVSEPGSRGDTDGGEDDVFMTLQLPVERGDSRSSSGSSTNGGNGAGCTSFITPSTSADMFSTSPYTHPHANNHHLHRMHYFSRPQQRTSPSTPNGNSSSNGQNGSSCEQRQKDIEEVWVKNEEKSLNKKEKKERLKESEKIEILETYSYVQFAPDRPSPHEYSYPIVEEMKADKRESSTSARKNFESKPTLLPTKTKKKKLRKKDKHKNLLTEPTHCRHCHELFIEEDNERGTCEYAPDHVRTCINYVTCISCAQGMLYHCMSDAEGDFGHHPCSCSETDTHCGKRWIGLTLLSLFVPCLCCFLPLRACHKCGINCGICGGRHEAGS